MCAIRFFFLYLSLRHYSCFIYLFIAVCSGLLPSSLLLFFFFYSINNVVSVTCEYWLVFQFQLATSAAITSFVCCVCAISLPSSARSSSDRSMDRSDRYAYYCVHIVEVVPNCEYVYLCLCRGALANSITAIICIYYFLFSMRCDSMLLLLSEK